MNREMYNRAVGAIGDFMHDAKGATAIEYGLIASGVGIALVSVMPAFNAATMDTYTTIVNYFG